MTRTAWTAGDPREIRSMREVDRVPATRRLRWLRQSQSSVFSNVSAGAARMPSAFT